VPIKPRWWLHCNGRYIAISWLLYCVEDSIFGLLLLIRMRWPLLHDFYQWYLLKTPVLVCGFGTSNSIFRTTLIRTKLFGQRPNPTFRTSLIRTKLFGQRPNPIFKKSLIRTKLFGQWSYPSLEHHIFEQNCSDKGQTPSLEHHTFEKKLFGQMSPCRKIVSFFPRSEYFDFCSSEKLGTHINAPRTYQHNANHSQTVDRIPLNHLVNLPGGAHAIGL
jgi:hypothetical protein